MYIPKHKNSIDVYQTQLNINVNLTKEGLEDIVRYLCT